MGREKKSGPAAVTAKDKHRRVGRDPSKIDRSGPLPAGLIAKPAIPKSKHQSYFEFVENKDKKKKLEFEITTDRNPPPGFEFIPVGNPALTTKCKEISREQDAMVFIVTMVRGKNEIGLHQQVNRIGHHVRETIVEQAREELGQTERFFAQVFTKDGVEAIPHHQDDINAQADAAIKDLFPKIPNTDRQMIIEHAFKKGQVYGIRREPVVGLQPQLPLSRRVQLAVLAHIRHTHTRYDQLLKETSWSNARRAVESLCLDILVKWRGDDETGRDQLDEILREVVVISDTEDSDSEEESGQETSEELPVVSGRPAVSSFAAPAKTVQHEPNTQSLIVAGESTQDSKQGQHSRARPKRVGKKAQQKRASAKNGQRNFTRYQAAWDEAVVRQRAGGEDRMPAPSAPDGPVSHGPHPQATPGPPLLHAADHGAHPSGVGHLPHPQAIQPREPALQVRPYDPWPPVEGSLSSRPQPSVPTYVSSRGAMHGNVNESGYGSPLRVIPQQELRSSDGRRLQDFLHPSIEPISPRTEQPLSRFSHPNQDRTDGWPAPRHLRHLSPSRSSRVREDSFLPHPAGPGHSTHIRTASGGYDNRRQIHVSDPYRETHLYSAQAVPQTITAYRSTRESGGLVHQEDGMTGRREDHPVSRGGIGDRSHPILIKDPGMHPDRVYLSSGQNISELFGRDCEIISVRRPVQEIRRNPEDHRGIPSEDGFVRLRGRPDNIAGEIITTSGSPRLPHSRSQAIAMNEYRSYPEDPSAQPIYVRRVERVLQPRISHDYAVTDRQGVEGSRPSYVAEQPRSDHPPPPYYEEGRRMEDRLQYPSHGHHYPPYGHHDPPHGYYNPPHGHLNHPYEHHNPPPPRYISHDHMVIDGPAPISRAYPPTPAHRLPRGENIIVLD